jgi:hypothetical protein
VPLHRPRARTETSTIATDIVAAVGRLRPVAASHDEAAWAEIETFIAISLRVLAKTNPSKVRDAAMAVEIQARMKGIEVLDD